MKNFQKINVITGWIAFAIALTTYVLTIEPTVSFWDCGEFVTSGYKLEVGHPPGFPMFWLLTRIFSMLAFGNKEMVPVMTNTMAALASSFTILFLFWSVTHIARRIFVKNDEEPSRSQTITIIGSGLVAALTFTYSDSFWFSSVETIVWSMTAFFTSIVFWSILKWENVAGQPYANRWIVLIAYLIGLSIGVHLLNLLAIPAMVFVYYFRMYKPSTKGVVITLAIAVGIVGSMMFIVIPGVIRLAFLFELIFTNGIGLPFNTGSIIYAFLLIGGLIYGIYFTYTRKKVFMNTIFSAFIVILIGYSSYTLVVIRANANPPMCQSRPNNVFSLLRYLKREQYGSNPVLYGQYFNAPLKDYVEGDAIYAQRGDQYVVVDKQQKPEYDPEFCTIFPRMYSNDRSLNHPDGYKSWTGLQDKDLYAASTDDKGNPRTDQYGAVMYDYSHPIKAPSFSQNLAYFFKYQLNFMYIRYFMWNFVGRQNDIQGYGNNKDGNWLSGIKFIDEWRLGNQDKLTDEMKTNKARNTYFFLPLILGILGMIFTYKNSEMSRKYFWIIFMFFFFTGIAILFYVNQPPFQPRERDYSYAVSFMAFSIWVGFGVSFLSQFLGKYLKQKNLVAIVVVAISLLCVPVLMAEQNWDDHDRSGRYICRDLAYDYLNSCPKNAIIFTNGDNDTYPLWYAQEVEGIRTDVRVINLSYLSTDWYISQMQRRTYESAPVPSAMTYDKYKEGSRDWVYMYDNPGIFVNERYNANLPEFEPQYAKLYERMMRQLSNSKFKEKGAKDFESLQKGYTSLNPIQFSKLIDEISKKEFTEQYSLNADSVAKIKTSTENFIKSIGKKYLPLNLAMSFVLNDNEAFKIDPGNGSPQNYFPTTKFSIAVDKNKIINNKMVSPQYNDKIGSSVEWEFKRSSIMKNDLAMFDFINTSNWDRPICFAVTMGGENYLHLENYLKLNGLAYQLTPVKSYGQTNISRSFIDTDVLYDNLMHKFKWGGLNNPKVFIDENISRMTTSIKVGFVQLAQALNYEGKPEKAIEVLNRCDSVLHPPQSPYNYYNLLMTEQYYAAKAFDKGDQMIKKIAETSNQEVNYYFSLDDNYLASNSDDYGRTLSIEQEIIRILRKHNRTELNKTISQLFAATITAKFNSFTQFNNMKESDPQLMQIYNSLPENQKQLLPFYLNLVHNTEIKE